MSITAIQLSGKVGQAAVVLATESEPDFQINVYPNPFSEAFIIDLGNVKAHKIEIVNMFGNTVFTQNIHSIDNKATINAQLKAGKYLLKIYKDKQEPIVKTLLAQ
jgi:predicted  nucleic acid-binding Zn-ribbon protein